MGGVFCLWEGKMGGCVRGRGMGGNGYFGDDTTWFRFYGIQR